jgi:repressor LexA
VKPVEFTDILDHWAWVSPRAHSMKGDLPQGVAGLDDVRPRGNRHRRRLLASTDRRGTSEQRRGKQHNPPKSNPCSSHVHSISNIGSLVKQSNTCLIPASTHGTVLAVDEMTPRQRRILEFIRGRVREQGYPPTVREIGEAVGLTSSSSVHAQIANLQRKGLLRKDPAKPRAIEVAGERPGDAVTVPLLGRIAAGAPVLAEEHIEEFLTVPASFAGDQEHFALTVRGDSMVDAGILDGDIVVVRRQDSAKDGDIVVALLPGPAEEEATVKRLRRKNDQTTLVPENPTLEPFEFPAEGRILGVVVSVLRRL